MRDIRPDSSTLLASEAPESVGEPVRLDKLRFLNALHNMRSAGSTSALRTAIEELRGDLRNPRGVLRRRLRGEAALFSLSYLDEELDQITGSQTLERAIYYVNRLIKGVTEVRTSAVSDINLNRWKEYDDIHTDSLWFVEHRDASGAHSARYWGNFIPQIPNQMMRRYTKQGEWVLDPFAGSGTTLIEGQRLGRNTLGIELQPNVSRLARRAVSSEPNPHGVVSRIVTGDSASINLQTVLRAAGRESVQLAILHPPYFDIIKFSEDERDLSNSPTVESFLTQFGHVVDNVASVLDDDRFLVVVIGDKYANGEWVPLGFRTLEVVQRRGFSLKSIVVKNFDDTTGKRAQKELWKYRALAGGFFIFKHEYILVFRNTGRK